MNPTRKWRKSNIRQLYAYLKKLKTYFPELKECWEQKQPCRGVLRKKCSENMQQINRRTPMSKCDFSKVALLYWNRTSAWVFSCKFAAYFQNTFSQEHLCMADSIRSSQKNVMYLSPTSQNEMTKVIRKRDIPRFITEKMKYWVFIE